MANGNVGQVSKIIENQLRVLGDPRQMSVALREPVALREHRLDADGQPPVEQTYHMTANDSSSDSGESRKSDTNPEACWTVYDGIVQTDSLLRTRPDTKYDKSVQWKRVQWSLTCLNLLDTDVLNAPAARAQRARQAATVAMIYQNT